MKKILDFLIIFLLIFLIVGLFTKGDEEASITWSLVLSSVSNSYTVPASVQLNVKNQTADDVTFNSCSDIIIKSSAWIVDMSGENVCSDITLTSWESSLVSYSENYAKFENPGEYFVTWNIWWKELLSRFEIDTRGTISKVFIAFVYQPILNLMDWLIYVTGYSLGWAIILITIIVRIVLIWPQHKMMLSQKKLQAVQPKIKAIQDKYKGQQAVLGQKLMALYKKEKVNPMWSCGFLLIQMPILFVLYRVIMEIRDPANAYYLYSFLQNFEIDKIIHDFAWMDLFKTGMEAPVQWVILALCVWAVQFIQIKLSLSDKAKTTPKWAVLEKKKWEEGFASMMPDPEMMNKFMLYGMPAMVTVFTFSFFAWLWLYWWISTTFMIFQQLVVNKIIKKTTKKM